MDRPGVDIGYIVVDKELWRVLHPRAKRAIVCHELRHFGVDQGGRLCIARRFHDIAGLPGLFYEDVEEYGSVFLGLCAHSIIAYLQILGIPESAWPQWLRRVKEEEE